MKIFCLVLGCLFYTAGGQRDLLIQGPLGVLNLAQLEAQYLPNWLEFVTKYNKKYSPAEELTRRANFFVNIDTITKYTTYRKFNFTLRINEFADKLFDEFNNLFNGFNKLRKLAIHSRSLEGAYYVATKGKELLPESVDWREWGIVSPVKHQQECASCWAFSAAGCVESQKAKKTGKLVEASVQELVDCAGPQYYNDGCLGGLPEGGFNYVEDYGITSYSDYPYEARNTTCRHKKNIIAKTLGYRKIFHGDERSLAQAVAELGPVSAAVHFTENSQFYGDDIFDDPACGKAENDLNHAILIVGYGKEADGRKYWLVKNSYGTDWGIDGYFKVAKDEGNKCGIATYATFPHIYK